jgi:hypothetical protein
LPNTPQIILVPGRREREEGTLVLAQRGQFSLTKLVVRCRGDARDQLELALQVVKTADMLQRKYGYFLFTGGMLRASRGPSLLLWINEDEVNNHPQFPIGPLIPLNLGRCSEREPRGGRFEDDPMHLMVRSLF